MDTQQNKQTGKKRNMRVRIISELEQFSLPQWSEIPDVGLYLKQAEKYLSGVLEPLEGVSITGSMISNYVKQKIISHPVKKLYRREQLAALIFVAVAKTVLPLEDIRMLMHVYRGEFQPETAWIYFRKELKETLSEVCRMAVSENETEAVRIMPAEDMAAGDKGGSVGIAMLRNTIITVAYKVYLEKAFAELRREQAQSFEKVAE